MNLQNIIYKAARPVLLTAAGIISITSACAVPDEPIDNNPKIIEYATNKLPESLASYFKLVADDENSRMYVDEIALVSHRERELTDILNADTSDRVIDSNELASSKDLDNDGYTNKVEIEAGSDPFDSESVPLPIADMQGDYRGVTGYPVRFIGSMSYDPDWKDGGQITDYLWQILDKDENILNEKEGKAVEFDFTRAGTYQARLTVTNDKNESSTITQKIEIDNDADGDGFGDWFEKNISHTPVNVPNDRYVALFWGFGEVTPDRPAYLEGTPYRHLVDFMEKDLRIPRENILIGHTYQDFTDICSLLTGKADSNDIVGWTPSLGQNRGNIKSGSCYPPGTWH